MIRMRRPVNYPSVDDLFGQGSDPRVIVNYPRYVGEPSVCCPQCGSTVVLSRIPFQNGCLNCKDMGLNICDCVCSLCFFAWLHDLVND